ncbi:hypothetical protein HYW55_00140 [Candidatus Gottesmanbacteria bacterium]|nr:hypothetical protein [Candidatus Gottesmanbacteria bacterium]
MNIRKVIFLFGIAVILFIIIIVSSLFGSSKKEKETLPATPTPPPFVSYTPQIKSSPTLLPDTQPQGAEKTDELYMRTYTPDIYLANKTPYTGLTFSITRTFKTEPVEHFAFIVTRTGNAQSFQVDAVSWIRSQGLTQKQIDALDIEYR